MTWHYMTPHDITYTFAFNIHLHTHIYINIYVQYIYAGVQNYYKQNIMWGCHVPTCELYTHFMACLWEQTWPQITHNVWRTECDYTCSGQNTMWAADWTHTIWKQMPFWGDTSMREMFCAMCSDLPSITILKCSPCLYIRHVLVHVHGGGWFKNLASAKQAQRAGNQMGISDIIWHDRWELIWLSQYEPITVDIIWQTTRSIHLLSPFLGLVGNESVSIGHSTHHIKTQAAHFTSGTLTVRTHDLSCRENCHVYGRVDRRKCTTDWWVFEDHLPKYVWLRIQK